ncbi:tetratricopeptide repeat protein [Acaryochloris marina]|uniref:TPR domain protein, putative n=1 Tax=Acaryochloris marina (strain MBIC 11017) TaxID=329726 RepID=B0C4F2_ACAM1|nr:tetratricopeptide repeat protein [Acaryochloris marina]ABW28696.1 TPR domain protein, putative [Acaryochloris marina MBIC11017]
MDADQALRQVEQLVIAQTGERLSELQQTILRQVWLGSKYFDIADAYGCTEGHAKDVGSDLWKLLSQILGEKITKKNLRQVLTAHRHGSVPPEQAYRPDFVGRHQAIHRLSHLNQQGATAIAIQGEGGLGKTTLAQQYLQSQNFEIVLELLMAKEPDNITSVQRVVEEWLTRDLHEEPGLEFGISLDRLKRHLQQRPIGVLVDNLEPALDQQGLLIGKHRQYVELFRVLTDPRNLGLTLVTSRDRICEASLNLHHYRLSGLDVEAWQQYFQLQELTIDLTLLEQMHRAYGGNAKAMTLLCGSIRSDFGGDAAAFWQDQQQDLLVAADLAHLINNQIDRLQNLDPQAYQLFCRLGCYRYQTLATLSKAGVLALLWEVPEAKRRASLMSLQNRSLIECRQGRYWLHPVTRAASIARLQPSSDWQQAHRHAAQYWSDSVQTLTTTEDALQALEAFYHYKAIQDYSQAAAVLLQVRQNQWQQYLSLGSSLYRMGLHQSLLGELPSLMTHLPCDRSYCELQNILADYYWSTGQIRQGITLQRDSLSLSTQALAAPDLDPRHHRHFQIQVLDSHLSLGLYHLDLWELEHSAHCFQQVIEIATQTDQDRWVPKASICLALVLTHLGQTEQAQQLATQAWGERLPETEQAARLAFFMQLLGQTYTALGDLSSAHALFEQALTVAEASHYPHIQARTLTGRAVIHRLQDKFNLAVADHNQAIALFNPLNATCDLAEAYFQWGLTYQAMHQICDRNQAFHQATQLFTVMDAPCQVQRVLACTTLP